MRYKLLILFIFINYSLCHSQLLLPSQLDTCKVYKSLDKALASKQKVYILDISRKKLKTFPIQILELESLNKLILKSNKIDSIPKAISSLLYLQELNISKNRLNYFPREICSITNLKRLILNQNLITSIPSEIKQLNNLEYLDMWSNELKYIPDEISELKKLKEFDLRVILFSKTEKQRISRLLPNTEIHFSNSCNCGY